MSQSIKSNFYEFRKLCKSKTIINAIAEQNFEYFFSFQPKKIQDYATLLLKIELM